MADQIDTEEFQRLLVEAEEYMRRGIPLTQAQVEAIQASTKAQGEQAKKIAELNAAFVKLGRGTADLGAAMLSGQKGAQALNGGIDAAAGALNMITALIPGMRLLKVAIGATVGIFAFFAKESTKQADALFRSYQDLSRTGQATAGGMTDVFRNMQQFGYGIEELNKMTALLQENSQALASFGGTATAGSQAFAKAAAEIQHSGIGETLRMLGKTPDDINRGVAMFIRSQQTIGVQNAQIQGNLATNAAKYVQELDLLSKLTGQSAEQLQQQLEQANAESAFNQVQFELKQKALAGDQQAADQLVQNAIVNSTLTGTALKEFQQGIGGDLSAMSKTMMTASGAVAMIGSGSFKASDLLNEYGKGAVEVRKMYGGLAKFNATDDFILPAKERAALESRFGDQSAKAQQERAEFEQKMQKEQLDGATSNQVKIETAQIKNTNALQSFVNLGVNPATAAMKTFAETVNRVLSLFGLGEKKPEPGLVSADSDYMKKLINVESGGKNIANQMGAGGKPTSTAFGLGQMTQPTFEDMARNAGPSNPLRGKTFEDFKADTSLQMEALTQFSNANKQVLEAAKIKPTDAALYLMHFLGQTGGLQVLQASESDPLSSVVSQQQMNANKFLQSMSTVGDIKKWASGKMGTGYRQGGIASGPNSGYQAMLHGTEAIVPLANGKSIPVEISGFAENLMQQNSQMNMQMSKLAQVFDQTSTQGMMSLQLDRLDTLVRVMQDQVNVSTKILQQSR